MKAFYGDCSVYEGDGWDAPRLNVQAVVVPDDSLSTYSVDTLVLHGWDYYLYGKGRWYGVNGTTDLIEHVLFEDVEIVLKGRMIPNAEYQKILAMAWKEKKNPNGRNDSIEKGS